MPYDGVHARRVQFCGHLTIFGITTRSIFWRMAHSEHPNKKSKKTNAQTKIFKAFGKPAFFKFNFIDLVLHMDPKPTNKQQYWQIAPIFEEEITLYVKLFLQLHAYGQNR